MKPARIAAAAALAYIGMNAGITHSHERMTDLNAVGPTIASPLPLAFWQREIIIPLENGRYRVIPEYSGPTEERVETQTLGDPALAYFCDLDAIAQLNAETRAFLFWSRSPFIERGEDGTLLLRDARFYDPLSRDRFTVALPGVECEPRTNSSP